MQGWGEAGGSPGDMRGLLLLTLARQRLDGSISIYLVRLTREGKKARFIYEVVDGEDLDRPLPQQAPEPGRDTDTAASADDRPEREDARARVDRIVRASFYHRQRPDRPILVLDCVPREEDQWASSLGDERISLNLALRVPIGTRLGFFARIDAEQQHSDGIDESKQVVVFSQWTMDTSADWIGTKRRKISLYDLPPKADEPRIKRDEVLPRAPSSTELGQLAPVDGDDPKKLWILDKLGIQEAVRGRSTWSRPSGRSYPERRLYLGLTWGPRLPAGSSQDMPSPPTLELAGIRRLGFPEGATIGGRGDGIEGKVRPPFRPKLGQGSVPESIATPAAHTLVVRQPPLTCIQRRWPDDPVVWLVALQGLASEDVRTAWNRDVVETYHTAIRTARPDRAISLLSEWSAVGRADETLPAATCSGADPGARLPESWTLVFRVADRWPAADVTKPPYEIPERDLGVDLVRVTPGDLNDLYPPMPVAKPGARLDPLWLDHDPGRRAPGSKSRGWGRPMFSATGRSPRWRDHRGQPLDFRLDLAQPCMDQPSPRRVPPDIERLRGLAWSTEPIRREAPYGSAPEDADPRTLPMPPAIELQVLRIEPDKPAAEERWVRLGAFEVRFVPAKKGMAGAKSDWQKRLENWQSEERGIRPFDTLRVWWRRNPDESGHALHLNLDVLLPVGDLRPAGQDLPESEVERDDIAPPLLLPVDPPAVEQEVFGLSFQEWTTEVEKQQLALHLFSTKPEATVPGGRLLVLDAEPFLVAQVEMPALRPTGENNRLAYFDSDQGEGTVWLVKAEHDGYTLLLPPQAIGETSLKRPQGVADHELPDDPLHPEQAVADFRFSPPARLRILTAVRGDRREAVEPPFNTRRIFGDPSNPERGAPLQEAGFELLYGLSTTVRPVGAQLVELAAELGAPPLLLPDGAPRWDRSIRGEGSVKATFAACQLDEMIEYCGQLRRYGAFRDRWRQVHEAFRRRLAVLTVLRAGERPRFVEGVRFDLRPEAEIRRPTPPPSDVGDQNSPYSEGGAGQGRPRLDGPTWGLAGGADWGFESTSVYEEVWERPSSDQGEVGDLHFSALGGWGQQKALFAGEKTAIISRTGMGRAHFYSLERLGRIGVFWNRAKHVIVYERTVLPSDQFGAVQPGHHGRPILRKVREFVEVLEPERRYPEAGGTAQRCGPVEGIVFRSTVIPVDSSWGIDLPGAGWKVPLWRPGAVPDSVYLKPQVELRLAGDRRGGGSGQAAAACAEPQNLFFFTSTRTEDGKDTDAWPAVEGVDWVFLPPLSVPAMLEPGLDGRQPSDVAVPPGFGPCTFAIEPLSQLAANLNAGREQAPLKSPATDGAAGAAAKPLPSSPPLEQGGTIGTVLRSVTMTRAQGKLADQLEILWKDAAGPLHRAAIENEEFVDNVRAVARDAAKTAEVIERRFKHELKDIQKIVDGFSKFEDEFAKNEKIGDPCTIFKNRIDKTVKSGLNSFKIAVEGPDGLLVRLKSDLEAAVKQADSAKSSLLTRVDDWFASVELLVGTIRTPLSELRSALPKNPMVNIQASLAREIEALKGRLLAAVPDVNRLGQPPEGNGGTLEAEERALLVTFDGLTDQLLVEARRRLPKATAKIENQRQRVRTTLAKRLHDARRGLVAAAVAGDAAWREKVTEAQSELERTLEPLKPAGDFGKEWDRLSADLDREVGEGERALDDLAKELRAAHVRVRSSIEAFEGTEGSAAETLLESIQDEVVKVVGIVEAAANKAIAEAQQAADRLCADLVGKPFEALRTTLAELAKGGTALKDHIGNLLEAAKDDLDKVLDDLGVRELGDLGGQVAEQLRVWTVASDGNKILAQAEEAGIRLLRAFGDAPVVPGLDFNRERLGYYFDDVYKNIGLTPTAALFDRVGGELKGLGLRLPTQELVERFLPKLDGLKIGDLFPDFAGVKLDRLFEGVFPASGTDDRVRVTHGFDKDTKRGWIDAVVDTVEVGGDNAPLFEFAGLALTLQNGTFDARARLEADATQAAADIGAGQAPSSTPTVRRTASGTIAGNWVLAFGGKTFVTFTKTPLSFDEGGRLDFGITLDNTQLSPELSFLDQFLKGTPQNAGGFTVGVLQDGAMPAGVECLLDVPVPPMVFGAFGVSGLRFITGMQVRALKKFSVTLHAALGSTATPFTITIFILGGTGWVQCWGRYTPETGELESSVSVAIGVSAQLGFAFGPISGDVQLIVALKAAMRASNRSGSRLDISILMIARGAVDVAGLITAALILMLEVRFEEGRRVIGEGTASFSIRMGPFYTWRINQRVTYHLAGSPSSEQQNGADRHMQAQA